MVPVVPSDLVPELVRARWEERLTYTQIAERYPYYSRTALVRAIKRANHRRYYQPACAWCEKRFRTGRADARFCSNRCLQAHYWYQHQLGTASRPPEMLAGRTCAVCGASLDGRRADTRYCQTRCRDRARRQRRKGVQGG